VNSPAADRSAADLGTIWYTLCSRSNITEAMVTIPGFGSLFERAQQGDWTARDALYRIAFGRLRSIASALLQKERPGHTLQPTALVGELYLKFHRLRVRVLDEDHFFRLSARAMRQVLIDHGRNKASARRMRPDAVLELLAASRRTDTDRESMLAVRAVFEKLEKLDPVAARTVWLRAIEGLTLAEVSQAERRDVWRVRADYDFGVKWMTDRITRQARSSKSAMPDDHATRSGGLACGLGS
jgi:RNA polymerase sigma factor (TIGR02999 family)